MNESGTHQVVQPLKRRIAVVQHGDYRDALQIIGSGAKEPYFGMKYSLEILGELLNNVPYLLISLNARLYRERHGLGEIMGLPLPRMPRQIPGRIPLLVWGRRVLQEVRQFRPTHVLLRCGTPAVATRILRYCAKQGTSTLVILANIMEPRYGLWARWVEGDLVKMLNQPNVFLVGNHKGPATQSLIDSGVHPDKVVAWDWPGQRHPRDHATKRHPGSGRATILYVGAMTYPKGIGDLIEAVGRLQKGGRDVALTGLGDGSDLPQLRELAGRYANVHLVGRVSNDVAFEEMLRSTLVCVPSRHEFSEAMPLTLTEALASRTPVVASDHPVFIRAFREGEGLVFFPAKDPVALAGAMARVLDTPGLYDRLSETTELAFTRVECKTVFGDLIHRWMATFDR